MLPLNVWSWIARLGKPDRQVRLRLAGPSARVDPVSVLEAFRQHIHLIGANGAADPDIVAAANHVERIGDGEDIGAARERRKAAITERPIAAIHLGRCQAATYAAQIGARNAEGR